LFRTAFFREGKNGTGYRFFQAFDVNWVAQYASAREKTWSGEKKPDGCRNATSPFDQRESSSHDRVENGLAQMKTISERA